MSDTEKAPNSLLSTRFFDRGLFCCVLIMVACAAAFVLFHYKMVNAEDLWELGFALLKGWAALAFIMTLIPTVFFGALAVTRRLENRRRRQDQTP